MQKNGVKRIRNVGTTNTGLITGGSVGIAYAFLRPDMTPAHTVTSCKDMLNLVNYVEKYGPGDGEMATRYGFTYPKKQNIIGNRANLVLTIDTGYEPPKAREKVSKVVRKGYKKGQILLNRIEKEIGFKQTKITKHRKDVYRVSFGNEWCDQQYLLSTFLLLLRNSFKFNPKKDDHWKYIHKAAFSGDVYKIKDKDFEMVLKNRPQIALPEKIDLSSYGGLGIVIKGGINTYYNDIYKAVHETEMEEVL